MGKRHPNFPAWQWRVAPQASSDGTREGLQLLSVILFALAFLLLASGVFTQDLTNVAIGVIGLVAASAVQRKRQTLEA
ncbi:terminase [Pseudomonas vanderleydeniana]|uniref:Terminase n=1 Tax=Pseudomonas vanderleydeniana TaxID=2745495 RepID=A0A9E6TR55_9PSED|nr:terminase [Pseudomonas vanderleydeniana]QXI27162.1 terminase [Pseudomonas vanderleydeniana]